MNASPIELALKRGRTRARMSLVASGRKNLQYHIYDLFIFNQVVNMLLMNAIKRITNNTFERAQPIEQRILFAY